MKTVNINLTSEQARLVDKTAAEQGFANRSEFLRALLRYTFHSPNILKKIETFPFEKPSTADVKQIIKDFKTTKRYNKAFLKSLEKGLKESTYFEKK